MLTQYVVMAVFCRADQRHRNIEQMWAPDGRLAVSSPGLTIKGVDDINAQISQVHDVIADKGNPMRILQHWMGHADSKTTQIYAHYQPSDQDPDAVDRAFA